MADLKKMTDWAKLEGMIDAAPLGKKSADIDQARMLEHLQGRVKGQDEVLQDVARLIRLNWLKQERARPISCLLFLGPTGTGKTELA